MGYGELQAVVFFGMLPSLKGWKCTHGVVCVLSAHLVFYSLCELCYNDEIEIILQLLQIQKVLQDLLIPFYVRDFYFFFFY